MNPSSSTPAKITGAFFPGARTSLDRDVLDDISAGSTVGGARPGKVAPSAQVSSPEGTGPAPKATTVLTREERIARGYINADAGAPLPPDVDGLFGATKAYLRYKKESFSHRLILWYKLQGYDNREVEKLIGLSYHTVCQVCKQEWFQQAFVDLAAELGKDRVESFLDGQVLPALERTVALATSGESEAVRLAANKEILDRYLGKSTVKVESKSTVDVTTTTHDAAALIREQQRLDEQLRASGLHGRS